MYNLTNIDLERIDLKITVRHHQIELSALISSINIWHCKLSLGIEILTHDTLVFK